MADDDEATTCGASRYNSRGQRVDEIDLDNRPRIKTVAEMSARDWDEARAALAAFDAGKR